MRPVRRETMRCTSVAETASRRHVNVNLDSASGQESDLRELRDPGPRSTRLATHCFVLRLADGFSMRALAVIHSECIEADSDY